MLNRKWKKLLVFSLCAVLLCGCQSAGANADVEPDDTQDAVVQEITDEQEAETILASMYDFTHESVFNMKDFFEYMPTAEIVGIKGDDCVAVPKKDSYYVMQGGCTDGTYVYVILEAQGGLDSETKSKPTLLRKLDMSTWEIVGENRLNLGHGNGMAYNSKTHQLVVAHYRPGNQVSFINPDSLELVDSKTLDFEISNIGYCATYDKYVASAGRMAFYILDSDFNQLLYSKGEGIDAAVQGIDCDDKYIYIGNSLQEKGYETVRVYDWNGEYKFAYRIGSGQEQEAIFHYNDKFYITFYTGNGGTIYEIKYDFSLIKE